MLVHTKTQKTQTKAHALTAYHAASHAAPVLSATTWCIRSCYMPLAVCTVQSCSTLPDSASWASPNQFGRSSQAASSRRAHLENSISHIVFNMNSSCVMERRLEGLVDGSKTILAAYRRCVRS